MDGSIGPTEKSNGLIGKRTHDLPACSIVPPPITLPRAPRPNICTHHNVILCGFLENRWYVLELIQNGPWMSRNGWCRHHDHDVMKGVRCSVWRVRVTCRPHKSHSHAWRRRTWGCETCQVCGMLRRDGKVYSVTTHILSRVVFCRPNDKIGRSR
jgi:hypothetical protein